MLILLLACAAPGSKDSATADTRGTDTGTGDDTAADSTDTTDSADTTDTAECTTHADVDGDGYGDPAVVSCDEGAVADATDCDDADPATHPGAPELCDGLDNRCETFDPANEAGIVTFFPPAGPAQDETPMWGGGHARVPREVTLREGTYAVCPGTWFVNLVAPAPVTIVGVYGQASTTLYGVSDRILLAEDDLDVSGFTFTIGNADDGDGGAILHLAGDLTVADSTFTENTAVQGGAVAIEHDPYDSGEVTLSNLRFAGGYAERGAGLHADLSSWLRADNVTFEANVATDDGGGASVTQAANLDLTNCTFSGNSAGDLGGGLYAAVSWPIWLTDTRFVGNDARGEGAGAWLSGPDNVELSGVEVEANTAGNGGGGLAIHADSLAGSAVTALDNTADGDGGGLYVYASGIALDGLYASNNSASGAGGGVTLIAGSSITLTDSVVLQNHATDAGGLWLSGDGDPSVTATLTDTVVDTNDANDGGGARIEVGTTTLTGVEVTGNLAAGDGAGLWVSGDVDAGLDVEIHDNTAAGLGGGLFVADGVYTCDGGVEVTTGFRVNGASSGGAVAVGTGAAVGFVADTCDFGVDDSDNQATDLGPDVFVTGTGTGFAYGDDASFRCDAAVCE